MTDDTILVGQPAAARRLVLLPAEVGHTIDEDVIELACAQLRKA